MEFLEAGSEMLQNEPTGMLLGQRWRLRGTFPTFSGVCLNTREMMMLTGLAGCLSPESETTTPRNPGLIPDSLSKMFPGMFVETKPKFLRLFHPFGEPGEATTS